METEIVNPAKIRHLKVVNGFMLLQKTNNIRNFFSKRNFHKKNTQISEMLYLLVTTVKKSFKSLMKKVSIEVRKFQWKKSSLFPNQLTRVSILVKIITLNFLNKQTLIHIINNFFYLIWNSSKISFNLTFFSIWVFFHTDIN